MHGSNPVQGRHILSRNGSNGQTKQGLAVQHHQLHKQVQALWVSCQLHPPPRRWIMDPACWLWEKRFQAFETKWPRKLLHISYLEHKTNNRAWSTINFLMVHRNSAGNWQETETCMVRTCHTPPQPLQNHPSEYLGRWVTPWLAEDCWMDNIKEWTSLSMPELLTRASCKNYWKRISAKSSFMSP